MQDIRFALRLLRKQPVTSLTIVLTLALGISANTAMFAGFEAWVLRPLPFDAPERLVSVHATRPKLGHSQIAVAAANLQDWREQTDSFTTLAAFTRDRFNLQSDDEPVRVTGARVDSQLFPMLGVTPASGRGFHADEDLPDGPAVALIGDALWRTRFGGRTDIVGSAVRIDDELHQIIGVMPPGFAFPEWAEAWVPLALDPHSTERDVHNLDVIGRLAPGTAIGQAESALEGAAARIAEQFPDSNRGWSVGVKPLREAWAPPVIRLALFASLAASAFVLLVICANVASLMLAQATGRQRETALRTALGASRRRLVRQAMTESTLFALAGGLLGVLLGDWWLAWTLSWVPVDPPYLFRFEGLGSGALAYTLGISLAAGLACGIAPLVRSSGLDLANALKRGGGTDSGKGGRLRGLLVVAELAVSMLLVLGGLLMVLSFLNQQRIDAGYRTRDVMTARLSLTGEAFERPEDRIAALDRIVSAIEALPWVEHAGATSYLPASMSGYEDVPFAIEGRPERADETLETTRHVIGHRYLESLEIPLIAGRGFTASELAGDRQVVLVSERLAWRLGSGNDVLGRRIRIGRDDSPWLEVIGVVGDVDAGTAMVSLGNRPNSQVYVPYGATPVPELTLTARSDGAPEELAPAIRQALREAAPGVPIADLLSIDQAIERVRWVAAYFGRLFATYALIALVIAALGAYGIIADSVARQTREMGIRMALGARPSHLLWKVVAQGLVLGVAGITLGTLLAVPAAQVMGSMLIGVNASDPKTFIAVAALLLGVAVLASYLPARHAARLDPNLVLRAD